MEDNTRAQPIAESMRKTSRELMLFKVGLVLACTAIIISTFGFGLYLFSAVASDMRADLDFSYTTIGLIIGLAQLGFIGASLFSSMLVPRWGAVPVILGSTLLCGLGLLLLGWLSNVWLIGATLFLLAACAAATWTPMVGLITEFIEAQHRGKAMGLIGSGTSFGIFINGLIIPQVLPYYGWRAVWVCMGVMTLMVTALAALMLLRGSRRAGATKGGAGFFQQLPLILRANPWLLWGAVFLAGVSFMSFMNYISLYVRDDLGLPVAVSGDVLMIIGAVGMVGGIATGALADWIGIRAVLLLMCLLLLAAGLLVIYGASPVFLYLAALAYGIAYVGYFAMVPAYISKVYPTELSTTIFGGANFAMAIGAMLGNFLGGWSKSVLGGFSAVFVTGAIIAVLLIGLTLILKRENSPELENSLERTNNPVQ